MKVAILAGGAGTRLSEETVLKPKPMVDIGGKPILWHIMQHYRHYGFDEFVVALGYKGECIREFFANEATANDRSRNDRSRPNTNGRSSHSTPACNIELIETGEHTATGGRIKRLSPWLADDTFMLTWGDGLSDVDLQALLEFHQSHGKLATVTAVHPPARFGRLDIHNGVVSRFQEKPVQSSEWINGAFFVLEPQVLDYIAGDATQWEQEPMERLASEGQLMAWQHESFWQCMDTPKEVSLLRSLWESGQAPWKCWN